MERKRPAQKPLGTVFMCPAGIQSSVHAQKMAHALVQMNPRLARIETYYAGLDDESSKDSGRYHLGQSGGSDRPLQLSELHAVVSLDPNVHRIMGKRLELLAHGNRPRLIRIEEHGIDPSDPHPEAMLALLEKIPGSAG